jgi:hypothetical protein
VSQRGWMIGPVALRPRADIIGVLTAYEAVYDAHGLMIGSARITLSQRGELLERLDRRECAAASPGSNCWVDARDRRPD